MLTHIEISNFKRLEHVSFDLTQSTVLVGPNNSGKSTIFQALCLWEYNPQNDLSEIAKRFVRRLG